MTSTARPQHLDAATLARIAGGESPSPADATHLARCAACRRALARLDPSALFSVLNHLPQSTIVPPAPRFASMPGLAAPSPHVTTHGLRRRLTLMAAAAVVVGFVGLFAWRAGVPTAASPTSPRVAQRSSPTFPAVVERVYSDSARVVTVVPPDDEGASFTVILDAGIDL